MRCPTTLLYLNLGVSSNMMAVTSGCISGIDSTVRQLIEGPPQLTGLLLETIIRVINHK